MGKIYNTPKEDIPCIYALYNLNNHRVYIGMSNNMCNRAKIHECELKNGNHQNHELQEDFNNGCNFSFILLEKFIEPQAKNYLEKEEKYYELLFIKKGYQLYNCDSEQQVFDRLYDIYIEPRLDTLNNDFRDKYGCYIRQLHNAGENCLIEKFKCL